MLTLFTVPKPFKGHIGVIQRNAISSWIHSFPQAQILLFGSEEGIQETAQELGVEHVADVALSPLGAPLLDDVFRRAGELTRYSNLCFINADIIFRSEGLALEKLPAPYLMIGESYDAKIDQLIDFNNPAWRQEIVNDEESRGPFALDYFFFSRGLFEGMPPFRIGRARYDNWMVWRALRQGAALIDGTKVLAAIHQNHEYRHLQGGRNEAYRGEDAMVNQSLAGLGCYLYLHSVQDADWVYTDTHLKPQKHRLRFFKQWRQRITGRAKELVESVIRA